MTFFYLRISLLILIVYSVALVLNSIRDYMFQLESGQLMAIGFFTVLSLIFFALLKLINSQTMIRTDKIGSSFVANIAVDFLSGFLRGYQKNN